MPDRQCFEDPRRCTVAAGTRRRVGAPASFPATMGMNRDVDGAKSLRVCAEFTTMVRSANSGGTFSSRKRQNRKARASPIESAATSNGRSHVPLSNQETTLARCSATAGAKRPSVIGGSLAWDQSRQARFRVMQSRNDGRPSSSASQTCPSMESSSHCSKSLASRARTSFQRPSALRASSHSVLPGHFREETKTNVVSARTSSGSFDRGPQKSSFAFTPES